MKKVNIHKPSKMVVDGHWFTRSRHAITRKDNPECTFMVDIERDRKTFMKKITMDLFADVRNLRGMVDQVVIVSDYVSWRKQVEYIHPPWLQDADDSYKSQREYDSEINWQALHNTFSEWALLMEKHFNIPYIKVHGAEADDLMFLNKTFINGMGENALLYATDGDTNQNIHLGENGAFTGVYKKVMSGARGSQTLKTTLTAPRDVIEAINNGKTVVDVFNFDPLAPKVEESYQNFFNTFNDDVFPLAFVLEKILNGDSKDNIFPIMYRKVKKMVKPKLDVIKKACELLGVQMHKITVEHLYDEDFIKGILKYMHDKFMNMEDMPEEYEKYYWDKYVQNRALVYLSVKEIPLVIVDKMKSAIKEKSKMILGTTNLLDAGNFHNALDIMGIHNVVNSNYGKVGSSVDPFEHFNDLFK